MLMLQKKVIRRGLVFESMTARNSHSQSDAGKTPVSRILFAETIEHVLLGTVPHGILAQTPGEILLTRTDHDPVEVMHLSPPLISPSGRYKPHLTLLSPRWPLHTLLVIALTTIDHAIAQPYALTSPCR